MDYKIIFNNRFKAIQYNKKYGILDAKEKVIWSKNEKINYSLDVKIELLEDRNLQNLVRGALQKSKYINEIVDKQLEDDENDFDDYYEILHNEYLEYEKEKIEKKQKEEQEKQRITTLMNFNNPNSIIKSSKTNVQNTSKLDSNKGLLMFLTEEQANAKVCFDLLISKSKKFDNTEITYYLMEYHSRKSGNEDAVTYRFWKYKDGKGDFNYFYCQLENALSEWEETFSKFTICVVPKSDKNKKTALTYNGIMANLLSIRFGFVNASCALVRDKSVKSVHEGGDRNINTHLSTIVFDDNYRKQVEGKECVLFDDIVTSGNTLAACSQILYNNGAKKVYKLVLGKTM